MVPPTEVEEFDAVVRLARANIALWLLGRMLSRLTVVTALLSTDFI